MATASEVSSSEPVPTMATTAASSSITPSSTTEGRASGTAQARNRGNVMTGNLPDDFLRLDAGQGTVNAPGVTMAPSAFVGGTPFMPAYYQKGGVLSLTVAQAKLAKNYGLSRMDPYCRLRIGNAVFETPTSYNGAKNPRWNKLIQCPLPDGVNQIYVEIFDECSFSPDERIAWGMVTIKDEVIAGESLDDWYCLSGKQGDGKEGMINLVLQYREGPIPMTSPATLYGHAPMMMYPQPVMYSYPVVPAPGVIVQQAAQQPGQPQPVQQQQQPQQPAPISEQDIKGLKDMFPNMDEEVIKSVLQASGGNMDAAVNNLLSMAQ